ncbi:hypothetical protein D6C95_07812 [Aureobasidium pullulans]|nr:hypothetical protein D6C95_07812 [Aureobasidium pullulans]
MTLYSCVSGDCHNTATKVCTSCKTTYYCSYDCQKAHWKKHKLTCNGPNAFPAMRPGIFDFMALPRKVRDKIYEAIIVSRFSPSEQAHFDHLVSLKGQPDIRNRRRDAMDLLERRHMVAPAVSVYKIRGTPIFGFKPLVNARGLSLANRQIARELEEVYWSKNTFLIPVDEANPFDAPDQNFRGYVEHLAKAKRIYLEIQTQKHHPGEKGFQACRQMNGIVTALNQAGDALESLDVRYTSCFPGEIEDLRIDADGLAAHKDARVIWVMDPRTDKMRTLKHHEIKQIYLHSSSIATALNALTVPVNNFRVFGDFAGPEINRMHLKFGLEVPKVAQRLDRCGQRISKDAEISREMARKSPGLGSTLEDLAKSQEQIFSTRALAIRHAIMFSPMPLTLPGGEEELQRRMALARMV